ncbi:MAG: CopG family transcriptional regulator [Acidobacteria bacterium]|nr:CopG family transcriptional regulator [Acidobacteriota bacterium]
MPFSLRLDPDTEAKIRKLTAATGRSKSEVVREAVAIPGIRSAGHTRLLGRAASSARA